MRSRRCTMCQREIDADAWEALESLGAMVIPPYEDDPGEVLDLRNCACGTTLSELEPYTGATFEAGVAYEKARHPGLTIKELRRLVFTRLHADPLHYGVLGQRR